ncbi:MAG: Npt1/Npt2 family nucleotide transporter [Candidatus Babeliales bacterium]|nr:Npt1/Npt2 family nucleotide transporter [Candidatus Babeliales bacterium]
MSSGLKKIFENFFDIEKHERLKVLLLTISFFLIIGAYTVAKELKDSVFMHIVGKSYVPMAKWLFMIILIPAIFLYAKLVDKMRRYQLLCFLSGLYGVFGILFAFLLGHPTIGLANTDASGYRLFGWIFYFFVEGYSPFVVSVFWAFANSINTPESAKKNYGIMVSGSKLGGVVSAGLAWYFFGMNADTTIGALSDITKHQIVMGVASALLLIVPLAITLLMKRVPGSYLHGYEAAYKFEKQQDKEGKAETGMFSGILMFIKYPYVLGIFGMVFFYEVVSTVLSYLRLEVAQAHSKSLVGVSSFLLEMAFMYHLAGVLIALFGTSALLRKLGERVCLVLIPLTSGIALLYLMASDATPFALMVTFVALKALNYAFSWPVRESLYIPTVKEIKFKSKSWIDAFGSKFAKSSGQGFNVFAERLAPALFLPAHSFFFAILIGAWFLTALLLGKRFDKAVSNNEVIGAEALSE